MERVPVDEVSKYLRDVVNLVANAKHRVLVHMDEVDRAGFVSLEDLALLENLNGQQKASVRLDVTEIGDHLGDDLAQVADNKERMILHREGQDMVALVPSSDVAFLESLDARIDLEAAKQLLEEELDGRGDDEADGDARKA